MKRLFSLYLVRFWPVLWDPMDALTQPLRNEHFPDPADLAAMADVLGRSPDYRVLRRLVPRTPFVPDPALATKTGVLIDTETTGLDHRADAIIELGMVKFDYTAGGLLVGVRDTFSAFNEPTDRYRPRSSRSPASPTRWSPVRESRRRP